jgi:hypothetical protein
LRAFVGQCRQGDVAAQWLQLLAVVGLAAHSVAQAETAGFDAQVLEETVSARATAESASSSAVYVCRSMRACPLPPARRVVDLRSPNFRDRCPPGLKDLSPVLRFAVPSDIPCPLRAANSNSRRLAMVGHGATFEWKDFRITSTPRSRRCVARCRCD